MIAITISTTSEVRFARPGFHLPDAPPPFGAYVPAVQTGNLLFLRGMLATSGHAAAIAGVLSKDLDLKAGREAAYTATLNLLALTKKQLGSLNRVSHIGRLGVNVAATPELTEHPKVADAASELLRDNFGEDTVSSRLDLGVASLPLGSPVELEVILEVRVDQLATDMGYIQGEHNAAHRRPSLYEDTPQQRIRHDLRARIWRIDP